MLEKLIKYKNLKNLTLRKNIFLSGLFRFPVLIFEFLSIRLIFLYLDETNYGLLITLYAISSWMSFIKLGFNSTLITKIASSIEKRNKRKTKSLISTALIFVSFVSFCMMFIILITNYFVNFADIINTPEFLKNEFDLLLVFVLILSLIQYTAEIIKSVLIAINLAFAQNLIDFFSRGANLLVIFYLTKTFDKSLFLIGISRSLILAIVPLLMGLIFFQFIDKDYKPGFRYFNFSVLADIWQLSWKFFLIQACSTIIFSTDSIIINQFIGPSSVAKYDIASRYFRILAIFLSLFAPFWSTFARANAGKDYKLLKNTLKKFLISFIPVIPICLLMIIFGKIIINDFWIGKETGITFLLLSAMAILNIIQSWNRVFNYFLNGVGSINITLITMLIAAIINIPLSIFFAKNLNLGVLGVTLGTIVSVSIFSIFGPLKASIILRNKNEHLT
tara:strand:+ start:220 stop:1560 length:1341 start_codon:yes stop_codon:yes gene_type:complete